MFKKMTLNEKEKKIKFGFEFLLFVWSIKKFQMKHDRRKSFIRSLILFSIIKNKEFRLEIIFDEELRNNNKEKFSIPWQI
jgi:hypothetical protein